MVQMKRTVVFFKDLYIEEQMRHVKSVKRKLARGAMQPGVWCLLSAPFTGERLAIMHSAFLKMPSHRECQAKVYGIAGSKAGAKRLVVRVSEDASAAGMEGRLKEYLDSRW